MSKIKKLPNTRTELFYFFRDNGLTSKGFEKYLRLLESGEQLYIDLSIEAFRIYNNKNEEVGHEYLDWH